jgi:hypothetical protein
MTKMRSQKPNMTLVALRLIWTDLKVEIGILAMFAIVAMASEPATFSQNKSDPVIS